MVSLVKWISLNCRLIRGDRTRRLGRELCGRAFVFLLLLVAGTAWADPKLEVSLDRRTIGLGEAATLSMTFQDCTPGGEPELPRIAGLQFGYTGVQQNFSLVNGSMTRSTVYTYEVRPQKVGRFTIPSLRVNVNGASLESRSVTLTVVNGNAPSPSGASETAFVKIVPATNVIYLGQVLPVEIRCYCRDNVANIQLPQLASDNFIVGDIPGGNRQAERRQVGDLTLNFFDFSTSVTAIKAGKYALGPATWEMMVYGNERNFFGMPVSHPGKFTSDTPEITVQLVPTAGAPASFSGAVGDYSLAEYEAGPTAVGVGDPITLKIRIAGKGSFDTVTLPTNTDAAWREFKTYPPTAKVDPSGSKYFEEVITPQNAEIKEIPPFNFSFFDPAQNGFRTLTHPVIPLTVHATAATPQPTVISSGGASGETQDQSGDIVHIKPMLGKVEAIGPPLILQKKFLALQALAPLLWICAVARRKVRENLANNPRLRRQRQVAEVVRDGLARLARSATANDAEKFYATVLRVLQEQLGERLDLPAPAITEAVVDDLPQKGLRPETAALLHELFHACNQYRYTPEHTSREMASLIPKVKTALRDLQDMPAAPARSSFPAGVGLVLLLLAATTLRAETSPDPFIQANRFYEEGRYAQAAAAYEKMTQSGTVSSALYFNLGNACLKAGQIGHAIRAYRQAEAIAPRDPDIRANLQIARTQAGFSNPALPGTRWTRWVGRLTLDEWTIAAYVAVALFFLYLTAREMWPALKRNGAAMVYVFGLACVCLCACLGLAVNQRLIEKSSVVIVPEAVARRGPLPESQSLFTIHDGAELRVLGSDGDWLQVSDAANHIGWLAQSQVSFAP